MGATRNPGVSVAPELQKRPAAVASAAPDPGYAPAGEEYLALNGRDLEYFARVTESSLRVRNRHHFFLWVQGALQCLLPHRLIICGCRSRGNDLHIEKFSDYVVPEAHFREICTPRSGLLARTVEEWRRGDSQPGVASARGGGALYRSIENDLRQYELENLAVHCMLDFNGEMCSQFVFARIPEPLGPRYAYMLQLLIPYLHATLMRTRMYEQQEPQVTLSARALLTEREAEILRWVQHGKSNSEIGQQLNISPLTVKNHVQNILKKLGVQNRAEAVAKGISQKLITSYGPQ